MRVSGINRTAVADLLRHRSSEIEAAMRTRISALSDLNSFDPAYRDGLQRALSTALNHGFDAIDRGEERLPPVPPELLLQARLAARSGVTVDTVLRHYIAGHGLLNDFLLEEARNTPHLNCATLQRVTRDIAIAFDHLLNAITEEYVRESANRLNSTSERRADRIRRLLAGEPLDTSQLAYDFDGWHIGISARGLDAGDALRNLAAALELPVLSVRTDQEHWAWLGGRSKLDQEELSLISSLWSSQSVLGVGEPAQGPSGWRLTHRQSRAALSIALYGPSKLARYADVALLASMMQDDLLTTSLKALYLRPLSEERDGGAMLRETLRAYLSSHRNVSAAAASLGVSRRTITNRLHTVEARLGRPLLDTLAGVDAALRLDELDRSRGASPKR